MQIKIDILDVNDNTPSLDPEKSPISIPENQKSGDLTRIQGSDIDISGA